MAGRTTHNFPQLFCSIAAKASLCATAVSAARQIARGSVSASADQLFMSFSLLMNLTYQEEALSAICVCSLWPFTISTCQPDSHILSTTCIAASMFCAGDHLSALR